MKQKIYIIDGHNFIYRLFYAVPPFSLRDGTPINTVFGLAKVVISWYEQDKPDKLIFVLDSKGDNYRHDIYPEYKATRDRMPSDLKLQEGLIGELLDSFNISPLSKIGFEADDIIGTLVQKLRTDPENDIYILSGDKDLYQFIDGNVAVYDTMKRKISHDKEVVEKFGVDAKHVVDWLSICGDTSDNIPGIPGFGPKKAQELIGKYGSLEDIYENIEDISGKTKDTLIEFKEQAFLSKRLASIDTNVELENFEIGNFEFKNKVLLTDKTVELFKRFEFKSLVPVHLQDEIKNFEKLGKKIIDIQSENELKNLEDKIRNTKKIGISTIGEKQFELDFITLYIGDNEIYQVNTKKVYIKDFLKRLLESDVLISGFDLKEDIKRIWGYIDGTGIREKVSEGQVSLF
ncbi:MAG: 5'-3' exonuclease H3TH domain-containing protein [Candidatus Gracilibacteria bacterium]|nr:5'-3' exonuclease H3TH domain-containing protein [Candidatus Gracilibacteria bacterium]